MKIPFAGPRLLAALLCLIIFSVCARAQDSESTSAQPAPILDKVTGKLQEFASKQGASTRTTLQVKAAEKLGRTLSASEWLGPLAPVALSPFFGIACLSGMTLFGGDLFSASNPLIGAESPLNNPTVFMVFAGLTILTSLPRLTKVSKPLAQAVDQLEAWAGIGTMLIVNWLAGGTAAGTEVAIVHAGVLDLGLDTLLAVAGVLNILVINAVKFFFEVLIWVTPVPFLDALFETGNKAVCAALMALYAYSPFLATVVNLTLFTVCLLIFAWARRREVFFRTMIFDGLRSWWKGAKQTPADSLVVFPQTAFGPFKARAKCRFTVADTGWTLTQRRLFRAPLSLEIPETAHLKIEPGFFTNTLHISGESTSECSFSRLYNACLPQLGGKLNVPVQSANGQDRTRLRAEFA